MCSRWRFPGPQVLEDGSWPCCLGSPVSCVGCGTFKVLRKHLNSEEGCRVIECLSWGNPGCRAD